MSEQVEAPIEIIVEGGQFVALLPDGRRLSAEGTEYMGVTEPTLVEREGRDIVVFPLEGPN